MSNEQQLKISDLLETSFDDIVDSPDFITPVPGSYVVEVISAELKDADEEKPYIGLIYGMKHAVEPDAAIAMNYVEGSKFSERYYGSMGASNMKKVFAQVREQLGANTLAELLDKLPGTELGVIVTNRKDRDDKSKVYCNVRTATCV